MNTQLNADQITPGGRPRFRWWRIAAMLGTIAAVFWLSGCMERMFYYPTAGSTPPLPQLPSTQAVSFQSSDGTRLHGWFIPAQAQLPTSIADDSNTSAAAATIIHVHGNAGNITSHIGFTDYLVHAGFNLFIFDYRGYGQSEGTARRRQPLIEDAIAAVDYVRTRPDVDVERIGMYGQSLGGAIAINVMAQRSEIHAAVIESAFVSWRSMAACALGGGDSPNWLCKGLAALLIRDTHRPDDAIARIQRPILLIHGTSDSIVPVSHSRALVKAANNADVTLLELAGGDHNSLRDTHPEIESAVVDFFRLHLRK